jgi:hypothetical protein
MGANKIATHLINNCISLKDFDAYLFGSTLRGIGQDIDILIIGPSGKALCNLKKEILAVGSELPLDVLYMLPSEAKETDFVCQQGCIKLALLAEMHG